MRLHNCMETAVINMTSHILKKQENICTCEKCKLDIVAIALNNLPPKYVVSEKGEVYTKIKEMEAQFDVDIIKELTKAIEIVSKNPRHNME